MPHLQLLLFVPAILAIGYAVYRKISRHNIQDAVVFLVCGVAVLLNALIEYFVLEEILYPRLLKYIQQLVSAMIVPMVYVYFSAQMATRQNQVVQGMLWSALLLFLLPHVVVFLDGHAVMQGEVLPWTFNFVRAGSLILRVYTADIVVLVQALITFLRIPPTYLTLRRYGMKLPRTIYYFGVWWLMAIGFIVFTSLNDTDTLRLPTYNWAYFGSLAFLVLFIYVLLAHDLDLRPRLVPMAQEDIDDEEDSPADEAPEPEQEIIVEDVAHYAEQSRQMADVVRRMMEEDKVYLRSGYSSKDMIAHLGTNRTYFSRMMMAEFGYRFSDWISHERVNRAKELMHSSDLPLSLIAEQSGFCDAAAMSDKFKQLEGVTPSVWRRTHTA